MTHNQRGRLTVDPDGPCWYYTNIIPMGSKALGTVRTEDGFTGALVQFARSGLYAQINDNVMRNLPQRKVLAALAAQKDKSRTTQE